MKFVALVSGGKDSCFNIMQCLNEGHELVAMANLHPKQDRPEEIDSWMFQTVGHSVVKFIAECSEVPLFTAEISEDEDAVVSELATLFLKIEKTGIDFDGISVGAIASTYQQLRVDKACEVSGKRSLAFLWQRDQSELLREITASPLDVRVVKVAGMGLAERHLGKSLSEISSELLEKHDSYGLHPCGEGGEYETIVLDAPFFKGKKLQIISGSERVVKHSDDDVFYLQFDVEITPKSSTNDLNQSQSSLPPPLLDEKFAQLAKIGDLSRPVRNTSKLPSSSITYKTGVSSEQKSLTVQGTFEDSFKKLQTAFTNTIDIRACYHVLIVLKSMTRFGEMNEQYKQVFRNATKKLGDIPPSRACIEAQLPWDIEITLFYSKERDLSGKGIHVQGLSYWAPASIGPYSQCRLTYGISYVAGQIGLVPSTLEVERSNFITEALLALQNATRVLDVTHESNKNWLPLLTVVYVTSREYVDLAQTLWENFFVEPLIIAVVDALPRGSRVEWSLQACDLRYLSWFIPEDDEDEEYYSSRPEMLYRDSTGFAVRAGFQIRQVGCNKELAGSQLILTQSSEYTGGDSHWISAKSIFCDGKEVENVYIKSN